MRTKKLRKFVHELTNLIHKRLPAYLANPENEYESNSNVVVCIIDEEGNLYGRIYGENEMDSRRSTYLAWKRAIRVWKASIRDREFEKRIYNDEFEEEALGIGGPEPIGCRPIILKDGTKLFVGLSGLRGKNDSNLIARSIGEIEAR